MADPVQAQTPQPPTPYRWIPIRSLVSRHRGRVLSHLLALSAEDRYLRFGYMASDEQIKRYVERLDFRRDEIFGIFNRRLQLIAMAHLAYLSEGMPGVAASSRHMAEFGVSVAVSARGRGYGARLFDHSVLHARNRGVTQLIIHALSENTAMLRIARNAGATVVRDGGEAEARLQLPGDSLASRVEALVESQAAELDYRFKSNAQHMDRLVNFFSFGLLRSRKQAPAANSELDAPHDPPKPGA
ncbi:GNAT family N-acetyltransferase [Ideonella azotifigens]|uniref:GNAT family N-acetyltransferase n=1 Tax=Ideonella azotifigens TaxID=513160 RepID=A0ABP3VT81_9BURK|nr:GNAT family N-acetyltransferase [Ideonella azotifigens]MCD2339364.1 GNAT family N-acetyltransferase [Ideonella azotifigens]